MTDLDKMMDEMMDAFKEEREVKNEALRLAGVLSIKAGQFLNSGSHSRNYAKYWGELKEAKEEYDSYVFNNILKEDD